MRVNFARRGTSRIALPVVARNEGVVPVAMAGDAGAETGAELIELISPTFSQQLCYLAYVFCAVPIAWARFTLDWLKR